MAGPNRGGKTAYTRAVGQVHVLAQAGMVRRDALVPVRAAGIAA